MRSPNLSVAIGLCMLLGTHAALSRAEDPKPADVIAEIRMLGGTVETDQNDPENPVVKITLNRTKVTDNHLEKLKVFPKLRSLGVNNTAITDDGVEHLKTSDKSLEHVKELPELRILVVCGNPVTDSGLEQLKGMTNLKHVYIYATKITSNGAKKLRTALPGAKIEGA